MDNRKRTGIQAASALIQNANIKGFFTGKIYQGAGKNVCVPGLNCYSCPGALGACPIGSLQNGLSSSSFRFPYYVCGLLIFFGALLGRAVCGFLCPFGFLQDLLDRINITVKHPEIRWDKPLRKLKYIVLAVMVVGLPLVIKLTPFFCKYLCPQGTVAGILLALADSNIGSLLGGRFYFKLVILIAILAASLVISRPFCRYLCPLGAFYGLFNRWSIVRISMDDGKCTGCGSCISICPMGIDPSKDTASAECIRCGKCVSSCTAGSMSWQYPGKLSEVKKK